MTGPLLGRVVVVIDRTGALTAINNRLARIEQELGIVIEKEDQIMTDQERADEVAAEIQAVVTDEQGAVANIAAEIAALQAAHPAVDFTNLNAAVAALQGAQAGVDALETPPAATA